MEVDTSIHSEEADVHLSAIKEFSPFNEYSIGQKLGLFDRIGTGTQIYIWNLDKWGADYSLEWHTSDTEGHSSCQNHSDILIRSRRIRSRPGQISHKVSPVFFYFILFSFLSFFLFLTSVFNFTQPHTLRDVPNLLVTEIFLFSKYDFPIGG